MLRRSTRVPPRGAAAAPFAQASGSAAGASSHPAVPPLGGPVRIDARLARTQRRSGLDLRLRVVVGQRCLHPEPLPPPEATGIGKVISTFSMRPRRRSRPTCQRSAARAAARCCAQTAEARAR